MLRRFVISTAILAGMAGIAGAQAASTTPTAPSTIQTGTYDLEIVFGGGVLEGTLVLTAAGDSLVATLHVSEHQSPVRAGTRQGNKLTLVSTSTAMDVGYTLEFTGDEVKGTFRYDGEPGSVTGKRRRDTP
jgi:hypothetical protein